MTIFISRDRNSTARLMNATSNLATYQFQDIFTDADVIPPNFPRTRDQFNALTGKQLSLVSSLALNDLLPGAQVGAMLTAYGLGGGGDVAAKRRRLGSYIGIHTA